MKLDSVIPILLTTEKGCQLARASAVFFGFLALVAFSTLLTSSWAALHLASFSPTELAALSQQVNSESELPQFLPKAHLFGFNPPASGATLAITNAPLRLTGLITGGTEAEGSLGPSPAKAIVSSEGGIGKLYQEGDLLPGGLRLTTIKADGLILDDDGHLEFLPLQRPHLEEKG